jgi:hypothetical protein
MAFDLAFELAFDFSCPIERPSHSEAPNARGKSVWLLCAFQSDPL